MPTTNKSTYAATFRTAVKSGTPASKAVAAIARNNNTNPNTVYTSLFKAGACKRQKCDGQWVYWPADTAKPSPRNAKTIQAEIWQQVIDWCVVSGQYKLGQVTASAANQQNFVNFCHRAIVRFNGGKLASATTKRTATKRRTARTAARKRTAKPATRAHARTHRAHKAVTYKFPHTATARRYRRAA